MILQNNKKGDIMSLVRTVITYLMSNTPLECVYRISVKALITDAQGRFLLCQEADGMWELPGGGLEYDETPQEALTREIKEEMGLTVTSIEPQPSYFTTVRNPRAPHRANVIYRATVENLDFTPSEECVEIKFFTAKEVLKEKNIHTSVSAFTHQYVV